MNICVFCGSSLGDNPLFRDTANTLGEQLAAAEHTLVYGGGNVGLMGVLADAVLRGNGTVIGVIPDFLLKREVGHTAITKLEVVHSMHDRKKRMADLADAFVAMPGGWGTLDEFAEILTWKQLRLVNKPVFLLNTGNFFDPLLDQMSLMVKNGFLHGQNYKSITTVDNPSELMLCLAS